MKSGINYFRNDNKDKIYLRCFALALHKFLSEKLYVTHYYDNEMKKEKIPFFFNMAGDERFLNELFLQDAYNDKVENKMAQGNIELIPRGVFTLNSASVISSDLTNRFTPGKRKVWEDGILKEITSNVNIIPVQLNVSVEILTNSLNTAWKLWEEILKVFYKIATLEFLWDNNYIRFMIGFPEDNQMEKEYTFAFGDLKDNKITFDIEASGWYPVFDEKYFNFNQNQHIEQMQINIDDKNLSEDLHKKNLIKYDTDIENEMKRDKDRIITTNSLSESEDIRRKVLNNIK